MAVGLPLKTTYANGDVYSASDVNDTNGTINITAAPYAAGKNKIINGDFNIWQRGTSFTTNGAYTADRFVMGFGGSGTAQTVSQQSFTAGTAPVAGYESTYFCRNAVTGGTGTGSLVVLTQKIEDVRTFAGQTVTFSFWAKANSGTPFIGIDLYQEFGTTGSPSATVSNGGTKVTISTTWARYSVTIAVASVAGKTITSNSLLGARFWFSSGSDYNSLNGSMGIQSNTFDIWGVQLESGSTATAFQTATGTIQGELAACQRYYYRTTTGAGAFRANGMNITSGIADVCIPLQTTMRLAPTAIEVTGTAADYEIRHQNTFSTCTSVPTLLEGAWNSVTIRMTVGSGLTTGQACQGRTTTNGYIGWSAEL